MEQPHKDVENVPSSIPEEPDTENPGGNAQNFTENEQEMQSISGTASAPQIASHLDTSVPEAAHKASPDSPDAPISNPNLNEELFSSPATDLALDRAYAGEIIDTSKRNKHKWSTKGHQWLRIWCIELNRCFLYTTNKLPNYVRSAIHVEFQQTGQYADLGGLTYPTVKQIKLFDYSMALRAHTLKSTAAWSTGTVHPNKAKITIKRDLSLYGGAATDMVISKEFYKSAKDAYLKNNTPVCYTTYTGANGQRGAIIHQIDNWTLRIRHTNQISPYFITKLHEANPGSFLLGGLNLANVSKAERVFKNQVSLSELLLHSPDFSRCNLSSAIDNMRTAGNLAPETATPDVFILCEGKLLEEWHRAIGRHLSTYSPAANRDRDTRYVLLAPAQQIITRNNTHATLPMAFMHDEHLARNHATALTIIEGGVPVGRRGFVPGEFEVLHPGCKLSAISYRAEPLSVGPHESKVGLLHTQATSMTVAQFLSHNTCTPPTKIALPEGTSYKPQGMVISYPRKDRSKVEDSVNHLGNGVMLHKTPFFIAEYGIDGAIFTGNLPWSKVTAGLNRDRRRNHYAMSLEAFLSPESWTILLGEGERVSPKQIAEIFVTGSFMRCGPRSYRVSPGMGDEQMIKAITAFNELHVKNSKTRSDIPFLNMTRGNLIHWFGAPRRRKHEPWTTSPDVNSAGEQGFVLIGASTYIPTPILAEAISKYATHDQASRARWFQSHGQWGVQLYTNAEQVSAVGPIDIQGFVFSLMPLRDWQLPTQKGSLVLATDAKAFAEAAASIDARLDEAKSRLPQSPQIDEATATQIKLAVKARQQSARYLQAIRKLESQRTEADRQAREQNAARSSAARKKGALSDSLLLYDPPADDEVTDIPTETESERTNRLHTAWVATHADALEAEGELGDNDPGGWEVYSNRRASRAKTKAKVKQVKPSATELLNRSERLSARMKSLNKSVTDLTIVGSDDDTEMETENESSKNGLKRRRTGPGRPTREEAAARAAEKSKEARNQPSVSSWLQNDTSGSAPCSSPPPPTQLDHAALQASSSSPTAPEKATPSS